MRKWIAAVILGLVATVAVAADRHVYVINAAGKLTDCPNPLHNAYGTSNTNVLQYCSGGTYDKQVIGTTTRRVTAANCVCGSGTVIDVTNGLSIDVDGDGINEPVYGSPQACIWNMAKSDSCEIHAGTYRKIGLLDDYNGGVSGTASACDKSDCFQGLVAAVGAGPNLGSTGYGTAASPGYLRGASMNSSIDSWAGPTIKRPASDAGLTSYPVIFSGDIDNDGIFDTTACTSASCTGDSFTGVIVGCGGGSYGSFYCSGATALRLDTDADGTIDTQLTSGVKNTDYLVVKDIEFKGFNGGNAATAGGARNDRSMGNISLSGNGSTTGLVLDHIYMHDNDFSLSSPSSAENFWAYISDAENGSCTGSTEIKNSYFVQNNEKVIDDDCGLGNECGCPKNFHDNLVVMDITSTRAVNRINSFAYFKSIDTVQSGARKKAMRVWNNEFVYKNSGDTSSSFFMEVAAFGNSLSHGLGELWVYGNLFRNDPSVTKKLKRFWNTFCGPVGTGLYKLYFFNNTFDIASPNAIPIDWVCADPGTLIVERGNAWFGPNTIHASTQVSGSPSRASELCTTATTACTTPANVTRTGWFTLGSFVAGNPTYYQGLTNYKPALAGPLVGTGTCDPDGDSTAGVDYNGDGTNDTTWADITGNPITCTSTTTTTHIGAIKP